MAGFDFEDLEAYTDPDDVYRYAPSTEIGAVCAHRMAKVMRVALQNDVPTFIGEEDVDLYALEYRVDPYSWWRLEIRERKGGSRTLSDGDHLVLAEHPWRGAARIVPFRRGINKPLEKRYEHLVRDDLASTMKKFEEAAHEPFRTDGSTLVAGISCPSLSFDIKHRRDARVAYVFGVCADPSEMARRVEDELDQKVMPLARAGGLMNPHAKRHHYAAVNDEDALCEIRDAAALQALAGPQSKKKSDRLKGKPVFRLAEEIFQFHLRTHFDQEESRGKHTGALVERCLETEKEPRRIKPGDAEAMEALLRSRLHDDKFIKRLAELLTKFMGGA